MHTKATGGFVVASASSQHTHFAKSNVNMYFLKSQGYLQLVTTRRMSGVGEEGGVACTVDEASRLAALQLWQEFVQTCEIGKLEKTKSKIDAKFQSKGVQLRHHQHVEQRSPHGNSSTILPQLNSLSLCFLFPPRKLMG